MQTTDHVTPNPVFFLSVTSPVVLKIWFLSVSPGNLEMQIAGPIPDLMNKIFWDWGPASLTRPPGDADAY